MVALALLLGLPPGSLQRELDRPEPPEIPAGVPSDLRRRRPDIRQAERTLASSSASIGLHRRRGGGTVSQVVPDRHRRLSKSGSQQFHQPFQRVMRVRAPGSIPIFQAGRLLANVDAHKARHREALAAYEKSVLSALREVEDGLATRQGE